MALTAGALGAVIAAAGCDEATEPPFLLETSPTPTQETAPVSDATPPTDEDFHAFAGQIDEALTEGDGAFFAERGVETEVTCAGDEQLGFCMGEPPGTVFSGIPGMAWQSDAFALIPRDRYAEMLQEWFAGARPDLSDEYGPGAVSLYAVAQESDSATDEEFLAISTAIVDTGPATEIQRQARVFRFVRDGGSWALRGEILAAVSATSEDWLSGRCSACYDRWERWEGVP